MASIQKYFANQYQIGVNKVWFYKAELNLLRMLPLALKSWVRFEYNFTFLDSTSPYIDKVFGCPLDTNYKWILISGAFIRVYCHNY